MIEPTKIISIQPVKTSGDQFPKKRKRRTKAEIAEAKRKEAQERFVTEQGKNIPESSACEPKFLVGLDFTSQPEILNAIEQVAKKQFRSVQQQIMFVLNEFCSDFIYEGKE